MSKPPVEPRFRDLSDPDQWDRMESQRVQAEVLRRMDTNEAKYGDILDLMRQAAEIVNRAAILADFKGVKLEGLVMTYEATVDNLILMLEGR